MGYQLVAISSDRPEMLRASLDQHGLGYRLYSDSTMAGAAALGLAWRMDPKMVERYMEYGLDIEAGAGLDHNILPVPAVFIVGIDGTIHYAYANPNHRVRLSGSVLLAAAEASYDAASKPVEKR